MKTAKEWTKFFFTILALLISPFSAVKSSEESALLISVRDIPDTRSIESTKSGELDKSHLSVLGFEIGENTLNDVMEKLGQAKIKHDPGATDPNEICYTSNAEGDQTKIIFIAGPMGGWENITEFQIISGNLPLKKTEWCTASPLISKKLSTKGGLRLGMNLTSLKKKLGEPTESRPSFYSFDFYTKRKTSSTEDTYWDVLSGVTVTYSNDNVNSISVYQSVSN